MRAQSACIDGTRAEAASDTECCAQSAHVVYNGDCLHEARRPSDCGRVQVPRRAPSRGVHLQARGGRLADSSRFARGRMGVAVPVRRAAYDDGDDGALVVCVEHMIVRDPSLNELAEMFRGFYADRAAQGESWVITDEGKEFGERRPPIRAQILDKGET